MARKGVGMKIEFCCREMASAFENLKAVWPLLDRELSSLGLEFNGVMFNFCPSCGAKIEVTMKLEAKPKGEPDA